MFKLITYPLFIDAAASVKKPVEITKKLVLYKTGFTLENGPLRLYNEPQNAEFMDSASSGR
jgi:hypothetical protein